ncbi:MAG: hypothetical protein H3C54_00540 [Taibaiella sp.]|nr:hypothetical protein [Taibaiella sp.]
MRYIISVLLVIPLLCFGKGKKPDYILTNKGDTIKVGTIIKLSEGSNDFNNGSKMYFVTMNMKTAPTYGLSARGNEITRFVNESQYMGQNMLGGTYKIEGFWYNKSLGKWVAYFYYNNPDFVYFKHVQYLVDIEMASKSGEIEVVK